MRNLVFFLLCVSMLLIEGCSQSISSVSCASNQECSVGNLCGPEGKCVPGEPVAVEALILPPAYVDEPYVGVLLQPTGGLEPYFWRFEPRTASGLEWLELVADTGEMRSLNGQVPVHPGEFALSVYVTDMSNGGDGLESSRLLSMMVNQSHCGPNPCPTGEICCASQCVDVSISQSHCGTCNLSCSELPNTLGASCQDGQCAIAACAPGFHNCDGDSANGCETGQTVSDCSDCGDDCADDSIYANSLNQSCQMGQCEYECQAGYGDCDTDQPGCETSLHTATHCGECGANCDQSDLGSACMDDMGEGNFCGCVNESHCGLGYLCCAGTCTLPGPKHCGACDKVCTPGSGGPDCIDLSGDGSGPYSCNCTSDMDCHGSLGTSRATCSPATDQCACGDGTACQGTAADACCADGCEDLLGDAANCGLCAASCAAGQTCSAGACACGAGSPCPVPSGATDCQNGHCVCPHNEDLACPPGQFCCPGPEPMALGCCLHACGDAGGSDGRVHCSSTCMAPKVWCEGGCCDSCEPADGASCS